MSHPPSPLRTQETTRSITEAASLSLAPRTRGRAMLARLEREDA